MEESFEIGEGEEEGESGEEEEGEEEIIVISKYEQLGFDNEAQYIKVLEEFQFFDKNLSGSIELKDVEKLIRVLNSTKNSFYFTNEEIKKKIEPVLEEKPIEKKKTEENGELNKSLEEEEEEVKEEELEEPEIFLTLEQFCQVFHEIRARKNVNHAEKELFKALKFHDMENSNQVNIKDFLEKFADIYLEEEQEDDVEEIEGEGEGDVEKKQKLEEKDKPKNLGEVDVPEFIENLKTFSFLTRKIKDENSESSEKKTELKKFRLEDDVRKYFDEFSEESDKSDSESEDEGEDEELLNIRERRKAKLFKSLYFLDYQYIPKKSKKGTICLQIKQSLLVRSDGFSEKIKALTELQQMQILDFVEENDFFNVTRFAGKLPDATLERNCFMFKGMGKIVEMPILNDCKLFNSQLDAFVCSFLE